jgi:hypothetical protein
MADAQDLKSLKALYNELRFRSFGFRSRSASTDITGENRHFRRFLL